MRPHVFPQAYIDGREQDVKDGVGPIIRGQEQHKQVREHGGSHSHRREMVLSHEGWTALYHCGGQGGTLQACSTQVLLDKDHVPMCGGKAQVRYEEERMVRQEDWNLAYREMGAGEAVIEEAHKGNACVEEPMHNT